MELWFVYLVRCSNDSLYCGIAKDPAKRFVQHASGKGARYTRIHKAVELVFREGPYTHGDALRRECAIKALTRPQKSLLLLASSEDTQS
ncbi:MAG: GIY-YIG nuclease family protein [Proteobacteria bacterium]|nr:MAG: GIY-YIG nuclease family protein [Pseudomonadota bacterium]